MAKYDILMSCGHVDEVVLFGKNTERERKIKYFEKSGLCKACYKKMMEEEAEKEGLQFNATVLPHINEKNGSIVLNIWFSGNTKPYKDEIKALGGYRWSERKAANDFFSTNRPPLCWNKKIDFEDLEEEIIKATSIGAESVVSDSGLFAMAHYQIALNKQKEWKETKEAIAAIEKPVVPEILQGCSWNQKIYGKSGHYSIYPNGEKVMISDDQAEEIERYLKEKEEYNKKIEQIKLENRMEKLAK